jgi:hypothetical protein
MLTNSKDYFTPSFLIENGLLKKGEEQKEVDPFAVDEPLFAADSDDGGDEGDNDHDDNDDNDVEEENQGNKEPTQARAPSPKRSHTGGTKQAAARSKKKSTKKGKKFSPSEAFGQLKISDDATAEEMKIRHISHTCSVAPYDNSSRTLATRVMVYAELPSGVIPRTTTAVQDGAVPNKVTITIERSKHINDPSLFKLMLTSGDKHTDDGLEAAAHQHVENEVEGMDDKKVGVIRFPYEYIIPDMFMVESGFRSPNDPTTIDNKKFIRVQSAGIEDKNGSKYYCNFVYFFLLAWTKEQFDKKSKMKIKGGGQAFSGGKKLLFSPGKGFGDYDSGSASGNQETDGDDSPSPKKKRSRNQISPITATTTTPPKAQGF